MNSTTPPHRRIDGCSITCSRNELIGLTATPERTDADDILHYFDNHIAVELRLWDALERGCFARFSTSGCSDNTDLSQVTWARKGYDVAALERLYTGDDARVRLVLQQIQDKLRDPQTMRALGFCVSIEHARVHGPALHRGGPASLNLCTADTDSDVRKQALAALRTRFAACALHRRPIQRRRRHSQHRYVAVPATDRERAGVHAAARSWPAPVRRQGLRDRAGLHRPLAPKVPVRSPLPGGHWRVPNRGRRSRSNKGSRFCRPAARCNSIASRRRSCSRISARPFRASVQRWFANCAH